MAWEDRTPAEQRLERRKGRARDRMDDRENTYEVITEKGAYLRCRGEIDAKILAGKSGTYRRK